MTFFHCGLASRHRTEKGFVSWGAFQPLRFLFLSPPHHLFAWLSLSKDMFNVELALQCSTDTAATGFPVFWHVKVFLQFQVTNLQLQSCCCHEREPWLCSRRCTAPSISLTHIHTHWRLPSNILWSLAGKKGGKLTLSKAFQSDLCEVMLQDGNCTVKADALVSQHQTTSVWSGRSEG